MKQRSRIAKEHSTRTRRVRVVWIVVALGFLLLPVGYARFSKPGVYMETWPDGSIKVRAFSKRTADGDYIFHGRYVAFHPNGRKEREGEMRNGKEEGPWTWWTETGAKRAEGDFHAGSGPYTSYHPNGRVWWEGRFENGVKTGRWTEWDEDGHKVREGPYVGGEEHGTWTYWHEDDPSRTMTRVWDHGVLLEEGAPSATPTARAGESQDVSLPLQLLQVLLLWIVLAGPLPAALLLSASVPPDREERGVGQALLVLLVGWIGVQTGVGLLLGMLGQLRLVSLLVVEAILLVGGLVAVRSRTPVSPWSGKAPSHTRPAEAAVMLALGIVGTTAAWWLLSMPPDNFDSLAYHLPTMIRWVQEHALVRMPELGQVASYPFHWEVLGALLLLPLREDLAVALPNLLAWMLLGLSVVLLARRLAVARVVARAAAALVLSIPVLLSRLAAVQPDLALAAFFLATLVLGGLFATRDYRPPWLAVAVAVAMLMGLKTSGLAYALLALGVLLVERASLARRTRVPVRALVGPRSRRAVVASVLVVVVGGGFWYLRNWIETGNPLGFVGLRLGSWQVLAGSVGVDELRRGTLARLFDPGHAAHWRILGDVARQHLALPFALLMLALLAFPVRGRRDGPPSGVQAAALLALVLATFLLYWNAPYGADNGAQGWQLTPRLAAGLRFGFPFLGALGLAAAVGLATVRRWAGLVATLAVVCCMLGVTFVVQPSLAALITGIALALACTWLAHSRPPWIVSLRGARSLVGVAALVWLASTGVTYLGRQAREQWRATLYGDAYTMVDRELDAKAVLGYASTQTRAPFYGRHFDRRLVSVVPRTNSREAWLTQIEQAGVDYLLVGTTTANETQGQAESNVAGWVEADPERFEPLVGYQSRRRDVSLYRVVRDEPTTSAAP